MPTPELSPTELAVALTAMVGVVVVPLAAEAGMAALANPSMITSATAIAGEAAGVSGAAGAATLGAKGADGAVKLVADKISGYTKHGLNQAISRDGGRGVSPKAILDAVKNPVKIAEQAGGKVMHTGKDAKVALNSEGKVVTTIPRNSEALRDPKLREK